MLASCSYDMTVALWDTNRQHDPLIRRWGHHTEFAVGIDLSALVDGAIASTGWDGMTYVWDAGADPGMLPPRLRV